MHAPFARSCARADECQVARRCVAIAVRPETKRNGVSSRSELSTLADHHIERLDLRATRIARPSSLDTHGNEIPLLSTYRTASGRSGALADVFFRFLPDATVGFSPPSNSP